MNFGDKLYRLRTSKGYSQEELAGKLGVSRQAISKWELGPTLPETESLICISTFFDVSFDYLLKDAEENNLSEDLDRMVIKFLNSAKDMSAFSDELVEMARDGVIDKEERERMKEILKSLDMVTEIINELKMKLNI